MNESAIKIISNQIEVIRETMGYRDSEVERMKTSIVKNEEASAKDLALIAELEAAKEKLAA